MARQKRDSEGRFASKGVLGPVRDNPLASAAVAAGAAAAGAFLWSKRGRIGETVGSGMDRLSELKSQRFDKRRNQEQISEEALTLKETGRKAKGPRGPIAQQDIKAGLATE